MKTELLRGGIVSVGPLIWYVIVNVVYNQDKNEVNLQCICDHANNTFTWSTKDCEHIFSPKQITDISWGISNGLAELAKEREIPYEIIQEVMSGRHDDRF